MVMRRRAFQAASSFPRRRNPSTVAKFSSSAAVRESSPANLTLSEKLKSAEASISRPLVRASEEMIRRTKLEAASVLRKVQDTISASATTEKNSGFKPENWKDDWGTDKLAPSKKDTKSSSKLASRPPPPHFKPPKKGKKKNPSVSYPRKIEGLIEPQVEPVLQDVPPTSEHKPVATLKHGLERVLFNPGVHWLRDPRSRVYNLTPYLEEIPDVTDFAFERLPPFIKSSRDEDLYNLAKREGRMFAGSTSSLSGMLCHAYFLLSEHKHVDTSSLSHRFIREEKDFTPGQRMASTVMFNYNDGVYSIDSQSEDDGKNILTWLGTLLEKFLTMSKEEFGTYLRSSPTPALPDDGIREAYRYASSEKFVMRSQLDGVDKRLPGTGVFDIKTRASVSIRMDRLNFQEGSGYMIKSAQGLYESFEREYYDLIRSAFLKYGFQVRIGNMDGVIVAYHNTKRLFGFQYVSLDEMDQRLFSPEAGTGDQVFQKCVGLLEGIAPEIVNCFPKQSVIATWECPEDSRELYVFVTPANFTPTDKEPNPPMRKLIIRAQNFLDDSPVNGSRAIAKCHILPWTVHWALTHSSEDPSDIADSYRAVMDRKFRANLIPTGVSMEELPQFWASLNFDNGPPEPVQSPEEFDFAKFRAPGGSIEALRQLSRDGKMHLKALQQQDEGRNKVVLGEPFDITDSEVESYQAKEERGPSSWTAEEESAAFESKESAETKNEGKP
ncbi:unnamed protein product [Mycena citricolor]|uniref:Pet127-domain-containing protein n=1 Tax=Mycena citricolor TaxID=2018698 RepID=A0AAD2K801_9AGAR|nr:unnamed protein product [Mycena citricolor]